MLSNRVIGIMGAMPEEINGIVALLTKKSAINLGMRTYYSGEINGIATVVVFSRWGKVAAATTVATLIHEFGITELIFTGVAGAINLELNIGDIVLGDKLIQHDMDARPLMQQFEIPLLNKTFFEADAILLNTATTAIKKLLNSHSLHRIFTDKDLYNFAITQPKLYIGCIASGDQFIAEHYTKIELSNSITSLLCVEMEGAAVAQVCYEYAIPFVVIRTISDTADEKAPINFPLFIKNISSKYSVEIIKNMFALF